MFYLSIIYLLQISLFKIHHKNGGNHMNDNTSRPLSLSDIQVNDSFWKKEIELVRTEVIPYQWDALNDQVEGASPSFCMRNFKVAGKMAEKRKEMGKSYIPPTYTFRGFEALPEDPANPDPDKFYGFVFQDTDFSKWIEAVGYSLTQHPDPHLSQIPQISQIAQLGQGCTLLYDQSSISA